MPTKWSACAVLFIVICFGEPPTCSGQSDTKPKNKNRAEKRLQLTLADDVVVKSELAQGFVDPINCDSDGNLYLMSDVDATSGIRKLNAKGERLALFVASSATDLQVQVATYFSVAPDGGVYQLAFLQNSIQRAVLVYNKDGTYKSAIKLDLGFDFVPSQVASFPSGDLLVTGLKTDPDSHVALPFNGIFSSNGTLRKQLALEDDESLGEMASSGDQRVVAPNNPFSNRPVEFGQMETGADGNIYLMRRLSPAIVYAITPSGETVKHFTIDPGNADFMPVLMHMTGGKIAVLFREPQTREESIKIVNLEGHEVATYHEPQVDGRGTLGSAFACYLDNPERFVFLYTANDGYLGFHIAEAR